MGRIQARIVHAKCTILAWTTLAGVGGENSWFSSCLRVLSLAAATAFFLLKVVDVGWLRVVPGWRSGVASLVIIGLLHVSVLHRAVDAKPPYDPSHLGLVLFVGTLMEAKRLRRRFARVAAWVLRGCGALSLSCSVRLFFRSLRMAFDPLACMFDSYPQAPRAPPTS